MELEDSINMLNLPSLRGGFIHFKTDMQFTHSTQMVNVITAYLKRAMYQQKSTETEAKPIKLQPAHETYALVAYADRQRPPQKQVHKKKHRHDIETMVRAIFSYLNGRSNRQQWVMRKLEGLIGYFDNMQPRGLCDVLLRFYSQ
jgi:hypothetical protein